MEAPTVTIIIATYNRPEVLQKTIRSVLLQTYQRWQLIVIGDNCNKATEEAIALFKDPRISYLNLPIRCGEQSGPNSVGIAMSNTPYLAFLNHDDLWLEHHLEYGLQTLANKNADFFIGATALARKSIPTTNNLRRPIFESIKSATRYPQESIAIRNSLRFEPCSSWIVRSELAQKVGYWQRASQLYRTPLHDWIMRAWGNKLKFTFGEKISVLRITTHAQYQSKKGTYNHESLEHIFIDDLLHSSKGTELILNLVKEDIKENNIKENNLSFLLKLNLKKIYFVIIGAIYYYTGWDMGSYYYKLKGQKKGILLARALKNRTGEELLDIQKKQ